MLSSVASRALRPAVRTARGGTCIGSLSSLAAQRSPSSSAFLACTIDGRNNTGSPPRRSKSTCPHAASAAAASEVASAAGCPVHAATTTATNSSKAAAETSHPKLVEVPSLPYAGSLIRAHSGIPPLDRPYEFWPQMREKFGDFYTMGMPGLGDDDCPRHTVYVVQDPREMMKVLRSEGSYPSGMAQGSWGIFKWEKDAGFETVSHADGGFAGQGENWKRIRTFLQTDLLHPKAARGYTAGILEAAELASRGAPASASDLNAYFERCAFDMFSTVMFGDLMEVADPNTPTNAEDVEFVRAAKVGLGTGVKVSRSLKDALIVKTLGLETEQYRLMKDNLDICWKIGSGKIQRFMEKRDRGELNEREKNSYLYRALERYESGASGVSLKEALEMSWGGIFAAVDTTSGKMGWNVLH
jgi:cytochrome P450